MRRRRPAVDVARVARRRDFARYCSVLMLDPPVGPGPARDAACADVRARVKAMGWRELRDLAGRVLEGREPGLPGAARQVLRALDEAEHLEVSG